MSVVAKIYLPGFGPSNTQCHELRRVFLDKYSKGLLYYQDRENNGTASAKICL